MNFMQCLRRERGATLLEMMIVVAIMGILAGLATSRMKASGATTRKARGTIPIGTIHSLSLVNPSKDSVEVDVKIHGFNVVLGTEDGGASTETATYYNPNVFGACMYEAAPGTPTGAKCNLTVPYGRGLSCSGALCTNTTKTLGPGEGMTLGFGAQHAHRSATGRGSYEYWGWAPAAAATRKANHAIWYEVTVSGGGRVIGHAASFEDSGNAGFSLPLNGGEPL